MKVKYVRKETVSRPLYDEDGPIATICRLRDENKELKTQIEKHSKQLVENELRLQQVSKVKCADGS